jgi:hypothetical protein
MKIKSLFLAALVTLGVVVSAVGKDEPRTTGLAVVPVKGSQVYKVIYRTELQSKIRLNIYGPQSQLLFTESFSGIEGFIRPVNFTGLQPGEYTIELVDASGKKVEKVNYQPVKSAKKNIHIANVSKEQNKFLVSVADAGEESITVRIYDDHNNVIHTETRTVKGSFAQVYVVKNAGAVTIEVSDEAGNIKSSRF